MTTKIIAEFVAEQGGQAACARALEVTPGLIHQWIRGIRPVSPKFALRIEAMTDGRVSRHDLRSDVFGLAPKKRRVDEKKAA